MADISQITIINGTTYNIKDSAAARQNRGIEYIVGTWAAPSSTWTGVSQDSELYDGKMIILYLPYDGDSAATLNLTLSDNSTTGAKNVYFYSTTRMTTQYGQFSHVMLIYHDSITIDGVNYQGRWNVSDVDGDDLGYGTSAKIDTARVGSAVICVEDT